MTYNLELAVKRGNPRATARALGHDKYMPDKPCPKGHQTLRYTKYGQCLDCLKISKTAYRATEKGKTKDKEYAKNYRGIGKLNAKLNLYGLTKIEHDNIIWSQAGKCAICKFNLDMGKKTCVDHCHNTKKVRGILCWNCNIGLGHFKNNPDFLRNAALYCEEK